MGRKKIRETNFKWVYVHKTEYDKAEITEAAKYMDEKLPYKYAFTYKGNRYIGCYKTEKEAAIALDKKFIQLGLTDRLQIFKPCR